VMVDADWYYEATTEFLRIYVAELHAFIVRLYTVLPRVRPAKARSS
jgi:hypothetical protein